MANKIKAAMLDAFLIGKAIGDSYDLVLYRDSDENGEPVELPAQNVLVELAAREPTYTNSGGAVFAGADGTLQKEPPFDVQKGDRFRLPPVPGADLGATGVVMIAPILEGGVIIAPFTLAR